MPSEQRLAVDTYVDCALESDEAIVQVGWNGTGSDATGVGVDRTSRPIRAISDEGLTSTVPSTPIPAAAASATDNKPLTGTGEGAHQSRGLPLGRRLSRGPDESSTPVSLHGAQHHSFRCVRSCSLNKQRHELPSDARHDPRSSWLGSGHTTGWDSWRAPTEPG